MKIEIISASRFISRGAQDGKSILLVLMVMEKSLYCSYLYLLIFIFFSAEMKTFAAIIAVLAGTAIAQPTTLVSRKSLCPSQLYDTPTCCTTNVVG